MKKIFSILVLSVVCITLFACNKGQDDGAKEIKGVAFNSCDFDYDGTEKSITATGIPEGISASYSSNKGTDAGTYNATVTLSGDGYKTKTMNATLTINKIAIIGVTFDSAVFKYDGEEKSIIAENIPIGVSASYINNKATDPGKYAAKVTLTGKNYITKILDAELEIKKNLTFAISTFGRVPTPWEYLPDSLNVKNKVIDAAPTYAGFVNVSTIPSNYIGKQLNVVYGVLNTVGSVLPYLNTVYGSLNVIEQAYNIYLASNPADPTVFQDDTGEFKYKLELSHMHYKIITNISGMEFEIYADIENESYGARIQISESNTLRYDVDGNKFKIAINVLNISSTMVEFERNETTDVVSGRFYEYLSVAGKEIVSTSAYLYSDENYTTVIGTKGDFIPTATSRNCEVYNSKTGAFVGSEVSEKLSDGDVSFDTLWYNLKDIIGITSIKKIDEANGLNPDTIYINNKTDTIHTKIMSFTNLSRRFDIEFKTVCAYTYDPVNEKYEAIEFEVPLMFIQEAAVETFSSDFEDKNDVKVTLNISADEKNAVNNGYHVLVEYYNTDVYEAVTQKNIQDYCAMSFA